MIEKRAAAFLCITLAGCSGNKAVQTDSSVELYRSYYEGLMEQTEFVQDSTYFSVSEEMAAADEGYTYAVIIDQPRTAMYDVRALVIEENEPEEREERMMPSSGILDQAWSLIPGQADKENGFVAGIALRGNTDHSPADFRLLVEWKGENQKDLHREYLRLHMSADSSAEGESQ